MHKDVLGQELKDGDFVVSASKSSDDMIFGVMKSVEKQTRVRIFKSYIGNKINWRADDRSHRMYTLARTLKLTDEMIVDMDQNLFDVMIQVREKASLPTNKELIQRQKMLKSYLEEVLV